jgi:NodT family efflux transporter outer membrane factor (OMF) lipoprotein
MNQIRSSPSRPVARTHVHRTARLFAIIAATLALAACEVGPDYARPNAPVPLAYKEKLPSGWTFGQPADGTGGGQWWAVFNDPDLAALEQRVNVDNQTIKESEAAYREAQALIAESRAGLFPTLGVSGGISRSRQANFTATSANPQASASWDLDVWGRIRRDIESSKAAAEVSAADLANARLSAQASLATLYFELRYQDQLTQLLRATVSAYQRALNITSNQAKFGIAAPADVITAQTQLDTAQSQLINAGVARAQDEHAIAALIGVPPSDLAIPEAPMTTVLPVIPVSLPSTLLQRRPDIAAAERGMQQQNAQIGVAVAAFYPDISLSAVFGYSGSPLSMLFNASHELWSIGANASETLFEGGLRRAQVAAVRAVYDEYVGVYRQTVLVAFQQVEDNLSGLRILEQQAAVQDRADADAQRAVAIALNEYQAGTENYTTVVQAQTILLTDQETALEIMLSRLTDTVSLAQALGGGWSTADLPRQG